MQRLVQKSNPAAVDIQAPPLILSRPPPLQLFANHQLDACANMNGCGVFDVEHPTRLIIAPFGGRVHQEWTHRDHPTG